MFSFMHHDLGYLPEGSVVEVSLDSQAYVRLFDESGFQSFRTTGTGVGYHQWATTTPVRLDVPRSGHWHVAVDFGGAEGQIRTSVNVLAAV